MTSVTSTIPYGSLVHDSLVGVLLTDGGEWVEEEGTGGGEGGTGVGVELMGGEEQIKYSELRTSVLASKRDTLYRSFQSPCCLAVASSFGADLDSRPPMTVQYAVIMRTRLRQSLLEEIVTEAVLYMGPRGRGLVTRPPPRFMTELCKRYIHIHSKPLACGYSPCAQLASAV